MSDELDPYEYEPDKRPRDRVVDKAKEVLIENFFTKDSSAVYYGRQLEVRLERQFFHWITSKALGELVQDGAIRFSEEQTEHHKAHFYWSLRHRYARRQIAETLGLIAEFSHPDFTRAVGHHGEILADAGFARIGFRVRQKKVREVDGRRWIESNHDLDRLIERDGIRYGVEIKNQLAYIDLEEFQIKLAMCRHFGVRPMFIARMMPKNYINEVRLAGGFSLILANQHYPLMADDFARRVREVLGLPVLCIRELPDTTLARFELWHEQQQVRKGSGARKKD